MTVSLRITKLLWTWKSYLSLYTIHSIQLLLSVSETCNMAMELNIFHLSGETKSKGDKFTFLWKVAESDMWIYSSVDFLMPLALNRLIFNKMSPWRVLRKISQTLRKTYGSIAFFLCVNSLSRLCWYSWQNFIQHTCDHF